MLFYAASYFHSVSKTSEVKTWSVCTCVLVSASPCAMDGCKSQLNMEVSGKVLCKSRNIPIFFRIFCASSEC